MCDFAAALADRVIPRVPVRQWVLTVPHSLRGRLAYDPGLTTVVLRQLIAAVSAWLVPQRGDLASTLALAILFSVGFSTCAPRTDGPA